MFTFASDVEKFLPLIIIVSLLLFFGLLIIIIIFVKRRFTSLQIKKDELDEEEVVRQELDRYLVPIEDEEIQKAMAEDEAAHNEQAKK